MSDPALEQAVGLLGHDRDKGLRALGDCFSAGSPPQDMDGRYDGRLIALTIGHGADRPLEALTKVWLPWRGKTFDLRSGEGRNLFTVGGRRAIRVTMPKYRELRPEGRRLCSAFRFYTSVGPSAVGPPIEVLRIDYRAVVENPAWPVRRVLDELVAIGDGHFLGQALLHWRGELRRAAWFSLRR